MTPRRTLRRLHIWLGWLVGVPLLFWTASGLWMVARPIAEVRGTALRADPPALVMPGRVVPPDTRGRALRSLALEQQTAGPVWIAKFADGTVRRADGTVRRADPTTGRWRPDVTAAEARATGIAAYRAVSPVATLSRTDAAHPPLDLRQPRPAWRVAFADGTHVYVDADSGAVLALRTRQWRAFDWMWGLHIMDLGGREDTSHALLIGFAALALLTTLLALALLPLSGRRRSRRE